MVCLCVTPAFSPVPLSSSSTWMEILWNAARTARCFSAHQYTPLSREDTRLMEMLKPPPVLSRAKEPLVFWGDSVPKISSQVTWFSLQKKRFGLRFWLGYSQLTVAPAALLMVGVGVEQHSAKRAETPSPSGSMSSTTESALSSINMENQSPQQDATKGSAE